MHSAYLGPRFELGCIYVLYHAKSLLFLTLSVVPNLLILNVMDNKSYLIIDRNMYVALPYFLLDILVYESISVPSVHPSV